MLYVTVTNESQNRKFTHPAGPLAMGRAPSEICDSFAIVDRFVSRDQVRVEELPGARLHLKNVGTTITLFDGNGFQLGTLERGAERECDLPIEIHAGYTKIHLKSDALRPGDSFRTITPPPSKSERLHVPASSLRALGKTPDLSTLTTWFETLLSVQRSAAGSHEFYAETARAVVDLVGLDVGLVVLFGPGKLEIKARHARGEQPDIRLSRTVLNHVVEKRCTYYQSMPTALPSESLYEVEAVVASPIFDGQDAVVGVVYGSRDLRRDVKGKGIEPLEAQFVQLLAGAVTNGLARVQKEVEAARLRVQFEQFFSPELSAELERNPHLLDGAEREISVLFADVRGYTRIAERLGAKDSFRLIGELMDRLTNRIMDHGGVIIDYYGDGLAAMWNAPTDQPQHAVDACRAGLALQAEMPAFNAEQAATIGESLRIGVGIHTGEAQVGNAGSQRRIKYGPRGHTVNLASRVEGATKQFGVPIVITRDTQSRLGDAFATRRLRQVQLVNIDHPVELHELHGPATDGWLSIKAAYEKALLLFETGRCELANRLLATSPELATDPPSQLLLQQVQSSDEPIWRLDQK